MDLQITDFNPPKGGFDQQWGKEWAELKDALEATPLHLKASDQAGIQGSPIFDPVGTNEHIGALLGRQGWAERVPIPSKFDFLGKDVDFVKNDVLAEVQFSNYPFLLNNLLRSELLVNSKTPMNGHVIKGVVIITKAKLYPSSNSTLYYEQALNQLSALSANSVFDVPLRLVGLFSPVGKKFKATWTDYHAARYSRTVVNRKQVTAQIDQRSARPNGRYDVAVS